MSIGLLATEVTKNKTIKLTVFRLMIETFFGAMIFSRVYTLAILLSKRKNGLLQKT
jgi:hypothetical protein